jgi:hypothetical protein
MPSASITGSQAHSTLVMPATAPAGVWRSGDVVAGWPTMSQLAIAQSANRAENHRDVAVVRRDRLSVEHVKIIFPALMLTFLCDG